LQLRTAIADKHKFVSKQVFPKNNYYHAKLLYFKLLADRPTPNKVFHARHSPAGRSSGFAGVRSNRFAQ